MPELPEVETTLKAIKSFEKEVLNSISIHNPNLRWLVDNDINKKIAGKRIKQIFRRAKYLIFDFNDYQLIVHLGMSGTLRIINKKDNFFKKHEMFFDNPKQMARAKTAWLAFPILIKITAPFRRRDLQIYLEERNIQTRVVFTGNILRQPMTSNINKKITPPSNNKSVEKPRVPASEGVNINRGRN